jgi:hypothetical protein
MARPKPRSSDQSVWVRFLLRSYEGLASLKLAVVLIAVSAVLLAAVALVDGKFSGRENMSFGTEAVLFGIYRTWGFVALNVLLFLNVLCALLIRFPWRRSQTGFVVLHGGILVLLAGCLLTRLGGIEANLPVFEEGSAHTAYQSSQHFELKVYPNPETAVSDPIRSGDKSDASAVQEPEAAETISVPFEPGPFNWSDYGQWYLLPWRLAQRDRGELYFRDKIRLEVLDYCRDSDLRPAPPLALRVNLRPSPDASQSGGTSPGDWEPVELRAPALPELRLPQEMAREESWAELPGARQIVFWVARSSAETDAFRDSAPGKDEPLGKAGRVVLLAAGRKYSLPLDGWNPGQRRPLEGSGLAVELAAADLQQRQVTLWVLAADEPRRHLLLFADKPDRNIHDEEHSVFGTYWLAGASPAGQTRKDSEALTPTRRPDGPRIDILQGADRKLYYRTWNPPRVEQIDAMPLKGRPVEAFRASGNPIAWEVERFVPHDLPGRKVKPNPFAPGKPPRTTVPGRALVQVTVDGRSERFWIETFSSLGADQPRSATARKAITGDGRRVVVSLRHDALDLGFLVHLRQFDRRLDPGSAMPSEYSSRVDIADRDAPGDKLAENVLITLNEPASVSDPKSGRCYRLYQSSFQGPWRRGEREYHRQLGDKSTRDELFLSVLSVNYDPGRPLKYAGTLFIVAGLVIVYYVRTYGRKARVTNGE